MERFKISSFMVNIVDVVYPLSFQMHFLVSGFKFQSELSDVQFQTCVLFVESFKLTLHLTERKSEDTFVCLLFICLSLVKVLAAIQRT